MKVASFLPRFNTLFGRLRFTRMSFGLTVVGDVFKLNLDSVFSNLDFCTGIADDVHPIGRTTRW